MIEMLSARLKNIKSTKAAPVAEWLRSLIFSALNRSSSHRFGVEPSSGYMCDKPSSACDWSVGFSRGSPVFAKPYSAENECRVVKPE